MLSELTVSLKKDNYCMPASVLKAFQQSPSFSLDGTTTSVSRPDTRAVSLSSRQCRCIMFLQLTSLCATSYTGGLQFCITVYNKTSGTKLIYLLIIITVPELMMHG